MVKRDDWAIGAALLGFEPAADRGHLLVQVRDCSWIFASGVEVTVLDAADQVVPAYGNGDALDRSASETDKFGLAAFFNVLPGERTVVVTCQGEVKSRLDVPILADTITSVYAWPNPEP